jgi:hypothetical protein
MLRKRTFFYREKKQKTWKKQYSRAFSSNIKNHHIFLLILAGGVSLRSYLLTSTNAQNEILPVQ